MEINESFNNDIVIIGLVGKLDTVTSTDLQDKLLHLIEGGHSKIVLNFEKLAYVSSAGLRVLLMAQKRVKPAGGKVVLTGVSDQIKEIFNISGFTQLFGFYDTVEESISNF